MAKLEWTADKLGALIAETFEDASGPVSAKDFADLYGVLAAQQDALLAVFALAMKANPQLIFTDEAVDAQAAIRRAAEKFGDAVTALGETYAPEEASDE